jgi:cobalt-precorrin-5B (C1)-methyltransferase
MTTHVAGNQVDFDFLAQICREVHAPTDLVDAVAAANTGRHFLELCQAQGVLAPVVRLVELACENCVQFAQAQGGNLDVEVILVDFDGTVLGRAARCRTADGGNQAQQPPLQPPLIQRLVGDATADTEADA